MSQSVFVFGFLILRIFSYYSVVFPTLPKVNDVDTARTQGPSPMQEVSRQHHWTGVRQMRWQMCCLRWIHKSNEARPNM